MKRRLYLVAGLVTASMGIALVKGIARERYLVPCGFAGAVAIVFDHPQGRPMERTLFGTYLYRFDATGILRIKDKAPSAPWSWPKVVELCSPHRSSEPVRMIVGTRGNIDWTTLAVHRDDVVQREQRLDKAASAP